MKIIIDLEEPIGGFWDGGLKSHFEFESGPNFRFDHTKDKFIRWGCWEANHWFECNKGKTDSLSLSYALKHLKSRLKNQKIKSIKKEY